MNENKQKEIEEMARVIKEANEISCIRTCDNCEYYEDDIKCISFGQAIALHNAGYRNCKDKVVLTEEEYAELKQAKTLLELREETIKYLEDANIRYAKALELKVNEKERQETAREIIAKVKEKMKKVDGAIALNYAIAVIEELAKQYGVEVEG